MALTQQFTMNELRVLRSVYENGPISRVRLASSLKLTRAGVGKIIHRLVDASLILEAGKGRSEAGRGRREVLLVINSRAGSIVAVHIALRYATFGLVNLNGTILFKESFSYPMGSSPELVLTRLANRLSALLEKQAIDRSKVYGIGLAIPGIVHGEQGLIVEGSLKGWDNFPLRHFFDKRFDFPFFVENDVKTLTLGEFQFGTGRHVNDMVCLWLEDGIGAGVMVNGHLLRGFTNSAGEVGFSEFILEQPVKNSILFNGTPGCWGDVLCFTNIRDTIGRGIDHGWQSDLTRNSTIPKFIRAVESRDPLGLYICQLLSEVVVIVVRNLIYSFNPKLFLLSGPLFSQLPHLTADITLHLGDAQLRSPIEAVELKTSVLGEDAVTIGCAALVLEKLLQMQG